MPTELYTAEKYIKSTLSDDSALQALIAQRVYGEGYKNPVYPCARFKLMSSRDTNGVCGYRAATNALYLIEAIVENASFADADPIVERIDELMQSTRVETEDGRIFTCIREEPYQDVEVYEGTTFHHRGGLYRIMIRANEP
jgi:hypothetical protein